MRSYTISTFIGFIPRIRDCLTCVESMHVIVHKYLRTEIMWSFNGCRKNPWQPSASLHNKNLEETRRKGTSTSVIKAITRNWYPALYQTEGNGHLLYIWNGTRMPTLTAHSVQHSVLSRAIRQEGIKVSNVKWNHVIKLPDDETLQLEHPKDPQKCLELRNTLTKAG